MNELLYRIWSLAHKQNRNALILVVGQTGSGKSLACIKMALELQKDWTLDNLVFKAKDFMKLVNSKRLKKGDIIIWDECSVEYDSRTFFSVFNRMISYVLETFRHRNLIVFFNLPHSSMVDINLRKLFHYQFECVGINYKEGISIIKPFEIEVSNRYRSKPYFKYPRTRDDNGHITTINRMEVTLPPQDIIDSYEVRKIEFTDWLNKKAEKEIIEGEERSDSTKLKDVGGIVEEVKKHIDKYEKQRGERIFVDANLIMGNHKVGLQTARKVKAIVEDWLKSDVQTT